MWRAKWFWALAAGVILLGAGSIALLDTTGQNPIPAGAEAAGGSGTSPQADAPAGGGNAGASKSEAQGALDASPTMDLSKLKQGDLPLELTVEPACAKRGDAMTAKLKAVPGAYVSLIVGYADGQSFGTWYAGPTVPDGSLTYPWVVPPNAAIGEGHVFASGHDPAAERSGTVAAVFRIAGAKGC